MADKTQLSMLKSGVNAWNEWRAAHANVRPELSEAHLYGLDLIGVDLAGADLRKADLRGTNLSDAVLVGANLEGVNFFKVGSFLPRLTWVASSTAPTFRATI